MEGFTSHISPVEGQTIVQIFGFTVLNRSFYVSGSLCSLYVHLSPMLPMAIQVPRLPLVKKKRSGFRRDRALGRVTVYIYPT